MLQLDFVIEYSSTDLLSSARHIEILDVLESLDHSLVAARQGLSSLGALLVKTCTLEQLAKLFVYSFPYFPAAAPCKLCLKEIGGDCTGVGP